MTVCSLSAYRSSKHFKVSYLSFSSILLWQDGIQVTILKDGREWDTFILDQVISKQGLMGTYVRIGGAGEGRGSEYFKD